MLRGATLMTSASVPRALSRRCVQPGRLSACIVRSAAASFPLHQFLNGSVRTRTFQPLPKQEQVADEKKLPRKDSGAQEWLSPAATTPQQHHVSHSRPLVVGSPPGLLGGSHTQTANSGLAAHGCYRVIGPARISKRGDCLVARLLPGSRLELLSSCGGCTSAVTAVQQSGVGSTGGGGGATAATAVPTVVPAAAAAAWIWDPDSVVRCACSSGEDEDFDHIIHACTDGHYASDDIDGDGGVSDDDGAVAECVLVASYVELGGSASSMDQADLSLQPAVHHHNGHTYLSVRNMPYSVVINLTADGDLSHPVNVTPPPPPPSQADATRSIVPDADVTPASPLRQSRC